MKTKQQPLIFEPSERFILDTASPIPLYHQMERIILDRITRGHAVGSSLPPEKLLCSMFGVSRITARKAYENLANKGLIERKRARGTRLIAPTIIEDLGRLKSFSEEMACRGLAVSTKLLGAKRHKPEPRVARKLMLSPTQQTLCIRRLRGTSEFFPIVFLRSEIPTAFSIAADEDFRGSLYELLEAKYRFPILWAEEEIFAAKADKDEAKFLQIQPGDSVLVMERSTYTTGDKPMEFVRAVYRPEHYTFSIRLKR